MSLADSINTTVIVIGGAATIYYARQQNQIFREQNKILAAQAGTTMPETVTKSKVRLYWPTIAAALFALGVGFVVGIVELRNLKPLGASAFGVFWTLMVMLVFTVAVMRKRKDLLVPLETAEPSIPAAQGSFVKAQHNVQCVGFEVIAPEDMPLSFATLCFQNVSTGKLIGKFENPRLRVIYYANSTGQEIADYCPVQWYPEDGLSEIADKISYARIAVFLVAVPVWRFFELNEKDVDEWHSLNYVEVPAGEYRIVAMLSGSNGLSIPPVTGILTLGKDGNASFLQSSD